MGRPTKIPRAKRIAFLSLVSIGLPTGERSLWNRCLRNRHCCRTNWFSCHVLRAEARAEMEESVENATHRMFPNSLASSAFGAPYSGKIWLVLLLLSLLVSATERPLAMERQSLRLLLFGTRLAHLSSEAHPLRGMFHKLFLIFLGHFNSPFYSSLPTITWKPSRTNSCLDRLKKDQEDIRPFRCILKFLAKGDNGNQLTI